MSIFFRWCKFNLVGALGMAVQLTTLSFINHFLGVHYLFSSACAVEVAVLHNFIWHLHFTWRDSRNATSTLAQLLRFHLSNGAVSLGGNLLLMHVLVHAAHMPLLPANGVAILCCSVANFCLSNGWAFGSKERSVPSQLCVAEIQTP